MNSPRFAPAGLLVEYGDSLVMLDGGGSAEPKARIDAWPVCAERSELQRGGPRAGSGSGPGAAREQL
jgi:hypothetical protein